MSKSRNLVVLLQAVGFLLVIFFSMPAMAVPMTLHSGEVVELTSEQVVFS
jgi:hypothetical protein